MAAGGDEKRSHYVNVDMSETLSWKGDGLHGCCRLSVDLCSGAVLAVSAPGVHVTVHSNPDRSRCHKASGGPHAWVCQAVYSIKPLAAILERDEGARVGATGVAEDPDAIERDQLQLK